MFRQVTDPRDVVEYWEAGVLYESNCGERVPAHGWSGAGHLREFLSRYGTNDKDLRFYICVDE